MLSDAITACRSKVVAVVTDAACTPCGTTTTKSCRATFAGWLPGTTVGNLQHPSHGQPSEVVYRTFAAHKKPLRAHRAFSSLSRETTCSIDCLPRGPLNLPPAQAANHRNNMCAESEDASKRCNVRQSSAWRRSTRRGNAAEPSNTGGGLSRCYSARLDCP
jgi:hypothetical protein